MVTAAIAFHTPYWWFDPIGKQTMPVFELWSRLALY
jgi:hypothetical protein